MVIRQWAGGSTSDDDDDEYETTSGDYFTGGYVHEPEEEETSTSTSTSTSDSSGYETTSGSAFTGGYAETEEHETTSADHFTGGYATSPSTPDLETSEEVDTSVFSDDRRADRLSDPDTSTDREPVSALDSSTAAFDDADLTNMDGSGPADVVSEFGSRVSENIDTTLTAQDQASAQSAGSLDPFGDRVDPAQFVAPESDYASLEEAEQDWERRAENLPGVGDQPFWGEGGKLEAHSETNRRLREEIEQHNEEGEYLAGLSKGSAYVANAFVDNPSFSLQRDVGQEWMQRSVAATDPTVDSPDEVSDEMIAERGIRGSERIGEAWRSGVTSATGGRLDLENPEGLGERATAFVAEDVAAEAGGNITHGFMGTNVQTGEQGAVEDGWTVLDMALTPLDLAGGAKIAGKAGAKAGGRSVVNRLADGLSTQRATTEAAEESADMAHGNIGRVGIEAVRRTGDELASNRAVREGFDWLYGGAARTADDAPTQQIEPTADLPATLDEGMNLPRSVNELPAVDSEVRNAELSTVRHLEDTPVNRMDAEELPGSVEDMRRAVEDDVRLIDQAKPDRSVPSMVDDLSQRNLDEVEEISTRDLGYGDDAVSRIRQAVDMDANSGVLGGRTVDDVASGTDDAVDATARTMGRSIDELTEGATDRIVRESAEETSRAMMSTIRDMAPRTGREAAEEAGDDVLDEAVTRLGRESAEEGAEGASRRDLGKVLFGAAGGAAGVLALGAGVITTTDMDIVQPGEEIPDTGESPDGWSWAKVKEYPEGGALVEVYGEEGSQLGYSIILAVDPEGQGRIYILEGTQNPQMTQSNEANAEGLSMAAARTPDHVEPGSGAGGQTAPDSTGGPTGGGHH